MLPSPERAPWHDLVEEAGEEHAFLMATDACNQPNPCGASDCSCQGGAWNYSEPASPASRATVALEPITVPPGDHAGSTLSAPPRVI
jgi:hypothetical protein